MASKTTDCLDNICPLCNETIKYYAVGPCDHPICHVCSTRMRVLFEQSYCAICRSEMPKVLFTRKTHKFQSINTHHFLVHRAAKIYFETDVLKTAFDKLLEYRCQMCRNTKLLSSFNVLKDHMRREHNLHCCDLCVTHLKIFSSERKFYDRKKLAAHRRVGDTDDTSHRGHPLCEFCDERYLDNDELVKHLRKDHYYCHFCETDGISNQFFGDYSFLREHFREQHYLCEEDDCVDTQFTNAFRSEIDLKAHKATAHSRNMRRMAARQARTLDIDFNLAPRPRMHRTRRREADQGVISGEDYLEVNEDFHRHRDGHNSRGHRHQDRGGHATEDMQRAINMSLSTMVTERTNVASTGQPSSGISRNSANFPTLAQQTTMAQGTAPTDKGPVDGQSTTMANKLAFAANLSVQDGKLEQEDFPSLGGGRSSRRPTTAHVGRVWSQKQPAKSHVVEAVPNPTKQKSEPQKIMKPLPQKQTRSAFAWDAPEPKPSQVESSASASRLAMTHIAPYVTVTDRNFPSLSSIGNSLMSSACPVVSEPIKQTSASTAGEHKKNDNMLSSAVNAEKPSSTTKSVSGINSTKVNSSTNSKKNDSASKKNVQMNKKNNMTDTKNYQANQKNYQASQRNDQASQRNDQASQRNDQASQRNDQASQRNDQASQRNDQASQRNYQASQRNDQASQRNDQASQRNDQASQRNDQASQRNDTTKKTDMTNKKNATKQKREINDNTKPGLGSNNTKVDAPTSIPKSDTIKEDAGNIKKEVNSKKWQDTDTNRRPAGAVTKSTDRDFPALGAPQPHDGTSWLTKTSSKHDITKPPGKQDKSKQSDLTQKTKQSDSTQKTKQQTANMSASWTNAAVVSPEDFPSLKHASLASVVGGSALPNMGATEEFTVIKGAKGKKKNKQAMEDLCRKHKFVVKVDSADSEEEQGDENSPPPATADQWPEPSTGVKSKRQKKKGKPNSDDKDNPAAVPGDRKEISGDVVACKTVSPTSLKDCADSVLTPAVTSVGGATSDVKVAPPPGFVQQPKTKAPPGFNNGSVPPVPLVSVTIPAEFLLANGDFSSSTDNMPTNGHNSQPPTLYNYFQPENFSVRNQKLIADIHTLLDYGNDDKFGEFKTCSKEFRRGEMSAEDYDSRCIVIMGKECFDEVFPELLVLLPDIDKQQELLDAHYGMKKKGKSGRRGARTPVVCGTVNTKSKFYTCHICRQVTMKKERDTHLRHHDTDADFPSLEAASGRGLYGMGSAGYLRNLTS